MESKIILKGEVLGEHEASNKLISFIAGTEISNYDTLSTLGIGYGVYQLPIIGRKIIIKLLYRSGQERYRASLTNRYDEFDSLIFTYTIDDMDSFNRMQNLVSQMKSDDQQNNIQLILIGYNNDSKKREVSTKEAEDFAKNNGLFFYEMKSSKDENIRDYINDAFLKIIPKKNPENNKEKEKEKSNKKEKQKKKEKPEKISNEATSKSNNEFKKEEHWRVVSPTEIKHLISKLDSTEFNLQSAHQKIKDIEAILEEMKPIKCDINYQKYFSILFQTIALIQDKNEQNKLYANIYLQLLFVFPDIKHFLFTLNKNYKVIEMIHSISNIKEKMKFYKIYTNNYTNFSNLRCNDIIKIYNFHFVRLINDSNQYIKFLIEFSNIINALYNTYIEIEKNTNNSGKTNEFVSLLIQSFGDVLIYIILKELFLRNTNELTRIINIIKKIFPLYFEMYKISKIFDNCLIYKIMCIYCIFFSYFKNDYNKIETIFGQIKNNSKICWSVLIEIYHSMNQTNKSQNT